MPNHAEQQNRRLTPLRSMRWIAASKNWDALKTHKKGLMQQLFPAMSETVPRLRFPEFWEAGSGKTKTIADLKPFGNEWLSRLSC